MKSMISVGQTTGNGSQARVLAESTRGVDFEHILELCRFTVSRSCHHVGCTRYHFHNLKVRGETDQRLRELHHWRDSLSFTRRAKVALNLSEALSLKQSVPLIENALKEARQDFDVSEVIHLTLAITAVNDWIDEHEESPLRILVVEDSAYDQELLRQQLQKTHLDQSVAFVSDGLEALDLLCGSEAQMVRQELIALFLDLQLPGMSGIELLRHIRSIPEMETLPVIVITGSRNPQYLEECQHLKVVSYIEKPVTFHSFSKAVADVFHRGSERENAIEKISLNFPE